MRSFYFFIFFFGGGGGGGGVLLARQTIDVFCISCCNVKNVKTTAKGQGAVRAEFGPPIILKTKHIVGYEQVTKQLPLSIHLSF